MSRRRRGRLRPLLPSLPRGPGPYAASRGAPARSAEERASEASGRVESAAERQRQAEAECQSLRQALEKRGLELRELRYRNLHLARELAQTKEAASESERTAREGMRAVRGSLADAERALLTRTKGLRAEHRTLQSLVEALERHTQRGMHVGPTATAQQLIGDMWRSLSGMARAVDSVGRAVTGITPAADTSRRRRARPEEGEGGSGDVTGGYAEGERQLLAETMVRVRLWPGLGGAGQRRGLLLTLGPPSHGRVCQSDICGDLEAENRQMRAELEVLREQVAEAHRRAEAASLVPQYRLAVVRSRAQAAALRQRTADQERLMDALRDRVADLEERLREVRSGPGCPTSHTMCFLLRPPLTLPPGGRRRAGEWRRCRNAESACGGWRRSRRPTGVRGQGCLSPLSGLRSVLTRALRSRDSHVRVRGPVLPAASRTERIW